jgi:hypothetical protein
MSDTKGVSRRHNAEEAIDTLRGKVATKQRLVAKAEAANEEAREMDSVYVDKLKNEVWVNVPTDSLSFHPVTVRLTEIGYELVNHVPGRELVFKYEA